MKKAIAAVWVFAFVVCSGALAADHSDDCASVLASTPLGDLTLLRVSGTKPVHFAECFAATCVAKAYVVPGDLVVAAPAPGDFVCTVFPNKRGGTKGWIPAGFLTPVATETNSALTAWAEKWQLHQNAEIEIKVAGDKLAVSGEAYWIGSANNAHTGDFAGTNRPQGSLLEIPSPDDRTALNTADDPEDRCIVKLRLIGPYLVAKDNARCGGLNVSFTGVYRRHSK